MVWMGTPKNRTLSDAGDKLQRALVARGYRNYVLSAPPPHLEVGIYITPKR
jgi:hypothetical protein